MDKIKLKCHLTKLMDVGDLTEDLVKLRKHNGGSYIANTKYFNIEHS